MSRNIHLNLTVAALKGNKHERADKVQEYAFILSEAFAEHADVLTHSVDHERGSEQVTVDATLDVDQDCEADRVVYEINETAAERSQLAR